jgi:hypothetical protein
MFRQGDVLLVPVAEIPAGARRLERVDGCLILAEGELTGHAHVVVEDGADLYEHLSEGDVAELRRRFLRVEAEVALVHEEHAPITLALGEYEVRRQREYEPQRESIPVYD